MSIQLRPDLSGRTPVPSETLALLDPGALAYLEDLTRAFRPGLGALLRARQERQAAWDRGERPDYREDTRGLREAEWQVAALPELLRDRRVEIPTVPEPDRLDQALRSGAQVCLADFEDGLAPTLANLLSGQAWVREAAHGRLGLLDPGDGPSPQPEPRRALLMVRPRGLHLVEAHVQVDGEPIPACLFDACLFLYHNAAALMARDEPPALYLAKLEDAREAAWWDQVLAAAEEALGLPRDCVRTTLLVETLPAAFQMDELLHAQRGRACGLNLGRWDYLFSFIKTCRNDAGAVFPDRGQVGLDQPFLRAFVRHLVRVAHRRGCLALGTMNAHLPQPGDPAATARARAAVAADASRDAAEGCDGVWVAHPDLVKTALAAVDAHLDGPNQLRRVPEPAAAEDLRAVPAGPRTERGMQHDLKVAMRYLEAWLRGEGCVDLYGRMEDTATAEICRMQVWQWLRHEAGLDGQGPLDRALFHAYVDGALHQIQAEIGEDAFAEGRFVEASDLFETLVLARDPPAFLTLPAYDLLLHPDPSTEPHAS